MPAALTDIFSTITAADSAPKVSGNSIIGLRIFREGTFKDSMGNSSRWTKAKLDAMVANFHALRNSGVLPNVPVREDHSRSVKSVVGYFTDVRHEGKFLVADIEMTEPDALQRYARGTYRARSAEIGDYEDNDGNLLSPCVLGLAFCDIPAVEGLYEKTLATYSADAKDVHFYAAPPQPAPNGVDDPNDPDNFATPNDALKDILLDMHELKDMLAGDPDSEAALQQIVDALTALNNDLNTPGDATDDAGQRGSGQRTSRPAAPRPTPAAAGRGNQRKHSQEDRHVTIQKFTVGSTTFEADSELAPHIEAFQREFSAVVAAREAAEAETAKIKTDLQAFADAAAEAALNARDLRVEGWVKDGKMTPAELEPQKAFCRLLTEDQFTAHAAIKEAAPPLVIAGRTAPTGTPPAEGGTTLSDQDRKIKEYRQTYSMLKIVGTTGDKLENSKAAKALKALNIDPEGE